MAIVKNKTKYNMRFAAYRADGKYIHQENSTIPPSSSRFIKDDFIGDIDWFVITAFLPESKIPNQFNMDAPETTKGAMPLVYAKMGKEDKFVLAEDESSKEFTMYKDENEPEGVLHGW
ncbi:hypothetical protein [Methanococcoides sp. NM1]|uniref:hypothetical protein n=1 Tax=Methanococcoides sp. NM1 TaxID=1201013 RepID=UPI001083475D|nr:hypothetical protein [Methanococcoides sp. NM1]